MLCDKCRKNDAIIYVEQTSLLGVKKLNLCRSCATVLGLSPERITRGDIDSIFKQIQQEKRERAARDESVCPVCGHMASDVRTHGKLGCPECYLVFKDELNVFFKEKKILSKYTGTMPRRVENFHSTLVDRAIIRQKLDDAVKIEDYEKAAFYRDYLKTIEKKAVATSDEQDALSENGEN